MFCILRRRFQSICGCDYKSLRVLTISVSFVLVYTSSPGSGQTFVCVCVWENCYLLGKLVPFGDLSTWRIANLVPMVECGSCASWAAEFESTDYLEGLFSGIGLVLKKYKYWVNIFYLVKVNNITGILRKNKPFRPYFLIIKGAYFYSAADGLINLIFQNWFSIIENNTQTFWNLF